MYKYCPICQLEVSASLFCKNRIQKDGLHSICKKCAKEKKRLHYLANKDEIKKRQLEYRLANKAKISERDRKRYESKKDIIKQNVKEYRLKNKDAVRANKRRYSKERDKIDIQYRLTRILRSRTYKALMSHAKTGSAIKDLGCSIDFLKIYLESKFKPGMTWENYGEWHLDHIIPLSHFNLSNREEFLTACNYANLQPLWAIENLKKGNKVA